MGECILELCKLLKKRYNELERKLSEWKEELSCEPLCENRYTFIRDLTVVVRVFYELLIAFDCM